MSLFNLLDYGLTKAYHKHKESKLEGAMDTLIASLESGALNVEVFPYVKEKNDYTIRGKVYRLSKDDLSNSAANYFLTNTGWLSKAGIDINDGLYEEALENKAGYFYVNLLNKYPNLVKNYNEKYNSLKVKTSLLIYSPEGDLMVSMPKDITVEDKQSSTGQKLALSKKASVVNINSTLDMIKNDQNNKNVIFSNYYTLAKIFAYEVAKELHSYDKDNIENAFKIFQEKHGKDNEISYSF